MRSVNARHALLGLVMCALGCSGDDGAASDPMGGMMHGGQVTAGSMTGGQAVAGTPMTGASVAGTPSGGESMMAGQPQSGGDPVGGVASGGQMNPPGGQPTPSMNDLTCENTTWDSNVSWVVLTHCTVCHSVDLGPGMRGATDRQAPMGINFDTENDVLALRERIVEVATGDGPSGDGPTMPKGYSLDAGQQAILLKWLECNPR